MTVDINSMCKAPSSKVFARAKIKRRLGSTGLYEADWLDISSDVKKYGKITQSLDAIRMNKFSFGNAKLVIENSVGKYNPSADEGSLWYGYLNQQRTLVRIEAGFVNHVKNAATGIYTNTEYPSSNPVFTGLISGDIVFSDSNEVTFNLKPLQSVFQEYPARNLTGWTTTGLTASQFVSMVRDHTDGSGSYIFRPFFDNTTSNWDISTTSNVFANLNTSAAEDVLDKNVWEIMEKLAEAESFIPYVTRSGVFRFISKSSVSTATSFAFHGTGSFNSTYGNTIKKINSYGFRASKYYSRVQIKFNKADTVTSYSIQETTLTVLGSNNAWALGSKTLAIENFYIPNTATAQALASTIFTDVSGLKTEIDFDTSFIPHLDIFDRFSIYYDPAAFSITNLWDQNDWAADSSVTSSDLIWDLSDGDTISINGEEFKFLSFEMDLDNFQNSFIAREV